MTNLLIICNSRKKCLIFDLLANFTERTPILGTILIFKWASETRVSLSNFFELKPGQIKDPT